MKRSTDDPITVVKIGGTLLDDPEARRAFIAAVARASAAERRIVLVHGGGAAVDRHLDRIGVRTRRVDGIRHTPPELMPEIAAVLAGEVGTMLVSDLRAAGIPALGLRLGDDDGLEIARFEAASDPGAVGTVEGGTARLLEALLANGRVPAVASIGFLPDGSPVNVNADDAAAGIARALPADRLLLLTDVPGVLDAEGRTLPSLDAERIEHLVADGVIEGGMVPKVLGGLEVARSTGIPVVVGHWADPAVLLDDHAEARTTTILPPTVETSR